MKIYHTALLIPLIIASVFLSGCNKKKPDSETSRYDGYPVSLYGVSLDKTPERVAVLSPSLAEIIADMGYDAYLIGRSEECDYPESVAALPAAGSVLLPDMDVIIGWKPDLLLTQKEPSDSIKELLNQNKIAFMVVPPAKTYDELPNVYQTIGKIFAGSDAGTTKGRAHMDSLDFALTEITEKAETDTERRLYKAVYVTDSFGHVATGDTVIHKIITAAGAVNAAESSVEWTVDADVLKTVEIIFCPETLVDKVKNMSGFKNSPAVANKKIFGLNDAAVERQSMRMCQAALEMSKAIYPELYATTTPAETSQTSAATTTTGA
ncbi:MAG: ABC transporter substrate-binding protein [Clostridiales bacterium]|jgi:iron complex transport system substrate-binding protein|nr:ABC transporter substrate-binding protein [Clostridiales bacterium]